MHVKNIEIIATKKKTENVNMLAKELSKMLSDVFVEVQEIILS